MSSHSGTKVRGRSAALLAAVVVVTTGGWAGAARPALAHEFTVALVTPTSGTPDGPGGRDVIDGFRLAVDRSPDVSHPAGADAGDHLGGVDVGVNVIDGTAPAVAAEAIGQQRVTGLTAVVVIAADPTARAVTQELKRSPVVLVIGAGAGASSRPEGGDLLLTQRSRPPFRSGVAAGVAAAFERAYGRDLSAAAALGYDAGRLLDAAVARAEDGVEDLDSVIAAAAEVDVNDGLVSSDVAAMRRATGERTTTKAPAAAADPGQGQLPIVAALGAGLLALVAGILAWRSRSRRDPPGR